MKQMVTVNNSQALESEYHRLNEGGHWFDRDTMRFFRTKIQDVATGPDGHYFITSEIPPHGSKAYSLRKMNFEGNIHTIGGFCEHTYADTKKLFEKYILTGER